MREEYKQFEKNIDTLRAAFESALTRCDNAIFCHDPTLAEMMASVAAYEFAPDEIEYHDDTAPIEATWQLRTIDLQVAIYRWLVVLDMPRGGLAKFKADIMRDGWKIEQLADWNGIEPDEAYQAVCSLNGYEHLLERTIYRTRNYFRRLVTIARGYAPERKVETKVETKARPKKSGGKYHDDELNANAKKYVHNYSPDDMSFKFVRTEERLVELSPKQFEVAQILLCGSCDDRGWVALPSGVSIPSNLKAEAAEFFECVAGDGNGRYRLMGSVQVRRRGGFRAGSGRKPKPKI